MSRLAELTLKEIAVTRAGAISTLEKYGLDYCCGGTKTLKKSCEEKRLALDKIEKEILQSFPDNSVKTADFGKLSPVQLITHIVNTHHTYIRKQLPVIAGMLQKIVVKHGPVHSEVREIAYCFEKLKCELEPHMRKEEEILFPYITKMVHTKEKGIHLENPPFRSVINPIQVMVNEHENVGNILQELRKWSNSYTPPSDACTTFIMAYQEIEFFEKDLHRHIHLENNLLFPQAIAMEKELIKY